jgi:hypothetical protein
MRNLLLAWTGLLLLSTATASFAGILGEVDQEFIGPGQLASVSMDAVFDRAQTFTVGIAGTLTTVEASLAASGETLPGDELHVDIRPTDASGVPLEDDGSALGSITVLGSRLDDTLDDQNLYALDFSSFEITVSPGDRLAIVARSDVPSASARAFNWGAKIVDGEGYTGGTAWLRASTWDLQSGGEDMGVDLVFRTIVMAPEPGAASALLAVLGALSLVAARRAHAGCTTG